MKTPQDFKAYLQGLGYKKSTVHMLPGCLAEFLAFSKKQTDQVGSAEIRAYYNYLQVRPKQRGDGALSANYIRHHIYALRVYFNWLQQTGEREDHPMSGLHFPHYKTDKRVILSTQEIKQLFASCSSIEEKAWLAVYYGCGLRRSEGEQLNVGDVQTGSGLLYVRSGKGQKRRVVPMGGQVNKLLKDYLHACGYGHRKQAPLFRGKYGQRKSGNTINRKIVELAYKAGIDKKVSLHVLRHSIASHLLEKGLSVEYIRSFLGHKHLETTQVYTHVSKQTLFKLTENDELQGLSLQA